MTSLGLGKTGHTQIGGLCNKSNITFCKFPSSPQGLMSHHSPTNQRTDTNRKALTPTQDNFTGVALSLPSAAPPPGAPAAVGQGRGTCCTSWRRSWWRRLPSFRPTPLGSTCPSEWSGGCGSAGKGRCRTGRRN